MSALSPYEQWMVRSNVETLRSTDITVAEQVALLRANGYLRVAEAVAAVFGLGVERSGRVV